MMTKLVDEVYNATGYRFKSIDLLKTALTHRSSVGNNNERLEFLGDSVLGMVIANYLYLKYPECDEGTLTRCRALIVKRDSLAEVARRINLGGFILLGDAAIRSGGAERESILGDVLEAIIGAVFLEGGLDSATRVVKKLFSEDLESLSPFNSLKDAKTDLQEALQKFGYPLPIYNVVEQKGPAHQREFVVSCYLQEPELTCYGNGASRRKAEQVAAQSALREIKITDDNTS